MHEQKGKQADEWKILVAIRELRLNIRAQMMLRTIARISPRDAECTRRTSSQYLISGTMSFGYLLGFH